jgi:para-nitrobenzyl esterase
VSQFKGIPFAAPPVGKLRWQAPQPVTPWSGVRQPVAFGPACMQAATLAGRMAPGVAPRAKGLFRAAIAESGANFMPPQDSPWAGGSIQTLRMAEAAG